jgi:predicted molibdopterin-dependent oxidoreductase YjgC
MRIEAHPILGDREPRKRVIFSYDGRELSGFEGEPILIALRAAGVTINRYTGKHRPRGVFCAIGRCTDCVMVVDGRPNIRTCVTALRDGMTVQTQVGAGAKRSDRTPPDR